MPAGKGKAAFTNVQSHRRGLRCQLHEEIMPFIFQMNMETFLGARKRIQSFPQCPDLRSVKFPGDQGEQRGHCLLRPLSWLFTLISHLEKLLWAEVINRARVFRIRPHNLREVEPWVPIPMHLARPQTPARRCGPEGRPVFVCRESHR